MRLALVLVTTVVLAGAATATADVQPVPAGFTPNAYLSRAASFVAGKPVTDYCAKTMRQFNAADLAATGVAAGAGYSWTGGTQSFLSTWVCSYLNRWLAKKPVTRYHLAASLGVLVHESELLSGVQDESVADCKGLAKMPATIRRFFPLRRVYTLHDVMGDAWSIHDQQPEQYLTYCPQR